MRRRTFLQAVPAGALAARATAPVAPLRTVDTLCEMCFWRCGVRASVQDERVTRLEGHPTHPLSQGRLCPRGLGGTGAIYDPDRLLFPQVRVAERGGERFRRVGWDEALDQIATRLRPILEQHGPESICGLVHGQSDSHPIHFLKALGSPNTATPSYTECRGPRDAAFILTYGQEVWSPEITDIRNTRCLTLIGYHLGENMHNSQVQEFAEALRSGAKLIVADPRFSTAAGKADYYLPVRAGTDLALLLAWIHVVLAEEWIDHEYLARHATGLAELREAVRETTPAWAEAETGIPAAKIAETARVMAEARPAVCVHPGRHASWYGDDVQRTRAIAILNALFGSYGREGGFFLPVSAKIPPYPLPSYPKPRKPSADGRGTKYPFAEKTSAWGLVRATAEQDVYPIKAWIVSGADPFHSTPDPRLVKRAIDQLDLVVVVDVLPGEIAGHADILLPECTYLERYDDLHAPPGREAYVAVRQPVVSPLGESRPNYEIFRDLGLRMGLDAFYPWKTWEDYLDTRLQKAGYSLGQLRRELYIATGQRTQSLAPDHRFPTPSGKIEIYSTQLTEKGFDPIPRYTRHARPEPGWFRLLNGRSPLHTFSRTINNPALGSIHRENDLWLNPAVARALGLRHGQRVRLTNQDGATAGPVRLRVTERIHPECVYMVHGFGHRARGMRRARGQGAAVADLFTRFEIDPIMGAAGRNHNFVRVEEV